MKLADIQALHGAFQAVGFQCDRLVAIRHALHLAARGGSTAYLMHGVEGCGKTTQARALAQVLGWDFLYVRVDMIHEGQDPDRMVHDHRLIVEHTPYGPQAFKPQKKGARALIPGGNGRGPGPLFHLAEASTASHGTVLLLDELDKATDTVDSRLQVFLDAGGITAQGKFMPINWTHAVVLIGKNYKRPTMFALKDRCNFVEVIHISEADEIALATGKVVPRALRTEEFVSIAPESTPQVPQPLAEYMSQFAAKLRREPNESMRLQFPPSTRRVLRANHDVVRLTQVGPEGMIYVGEIVSDWFALTKADRRKLASIRSPDEIREGLKRVCNIASPLT